MALRCQRLDCIHNNKEEKCFAQTIDVVGKNAQTTAGTTCNSYAPAGGSQNYEFANEFMDGYTMPSGTQNIKCAAENCTYNYNTACTAESVEINYQDASCETFEQ